MHALPTEAPYACATQIRAFVANHGQDRPWVVDGVVKNNRTERRPVATVSSR